MTEAPPGAGRLDRLRRAEALIDLKRYEQALETLAPLVAGPGDGPALCFGARALLGLGRPDEAAEMAGRAVAAAPDNEWGHRLRSASLVAAAKLAPQADKAGLAMQGRESAREACRLAPNLPVTYRNAVSAELAVADGRSAALALQRLIELAPHDSETWNTASLLALHHGDHQMAERHARHAIELDPNSSEAWNNLGVALQRAGRIKDAVSAYIQAARLDPGESLTQHNIARSGLLILRTLGLVALLPVLLVPDGSVVYIALALLAYWLWRPGGRLRDRAEGYGIRTAMRLDRMRLGPPRVQVVLTEVATRVVTAGAVFACLVALGNAEPVVGALTLVVLVLVVFARHVALDRARGAFGRRPRSRRPQP